jgi:hypothetical protein
MRIPTDVARVYEQAGPFATVYLDATRATGRGAEDVRLHWQALRAVLAAGDADEPTLRALDDAVAADRTPGEHGRVLVGAGGQTVLDVALPRASIRPQARWAPLPHLMPYLAQLGLRIDHAEQTLDKLRAGQGHGRAVQGLAPVIEALRRAPVDTLVLVDEPSPRVHAWIGPEPTQLARDVDELHDLGVDAPQPDRLDSAMVRAVAGTSAALLTVPPDDLSVSDGMAALLRQKH